MALALLLALPGGANRAAWAEDYARLRDRMVREEIEAAGVTLPNVLAAMRATPRHEFVLPPWRSQAYFDAALPIGDRQTISPPYVVAYMTEQLNPRPSDRILEIGTGSGYQAAVLSPLVNEVYTIEIQPRLGDRAERTLRRLGYTNVHVRVGDGYQGWPEAAPFDKIIVTCSPEAIPQPLVDQLAVGGRMMIPLGERYQQNLVRITKTSAGLKQEPLQATLFVPMTGRAEQEREVQPDPATPQIVNGRFEQTLGTSPLPQGWHYLRGATTASDEHGNRYLSFENTTAGAASRALQGLALDGREVREVQLKVRVRGTALAAGPTPDQAPALVLTCYDRRRAVLDHFVLGPWSGSFNWRVERARWQIPSAAREAILRVGLLGGVGQLDIDDAVLEKVPNDE